MTGISIHVVHLGQVKLLTGSQFECLQGVEKLCHRTSISCRLLGSSVVYGKEHITRSSDGGVAIHAHVKRAPLHLYMSSVDQLRLKGRGGKQVNTTLATFIATHL